MAVSRIPTPTVGPWKVALNGSSSELLDLTITSNDDGVVTGTLANSEIHGLWDDGAGKVSFLRFQDPTDPISTQVFTGYLSSQPVGIDQIGYTLIGTYQAFTGAGVTSRQNVFGWTAHMSRIA